LTFKNSVRLFSALCLSKIKSTPYKLNFQVTGACNSRCTTCNIWKVYHDNPKMVNDELTIDEVITTFQKLPDTIAWISLTGGEPFQSKDFGDIINAAIDYVPRLALITMPTSGLIQDRTLDVVNQLTRREHPDILMTFSIDGPEPVHDVMRGIKGSFKRTWDTYSKVRERVKDDKYFRVGIESTVSSGNILSMRPFFQKLLDEGHYVAVTVAHDAYLYQNENDKAITPRAHVEEFEKIASLFMKYLPRTRPVSLIQRQYLRKVPEFLRNPGKMVVPCESLRSSLALGPKGDVTPCLMWGHKLMNVRDTGFSVNGNWNTKEFARARDMIAKSQCPVCWTPCEAYQSILSGALKGKLLPRQ